MGVLYTVTTDAGSGPPGNSWTLQVDGASGFFFRYRGRFQVEREFDVAMLPITPFVNVELFWQQPPAQWTQFRIQGGLQLGFEWFARGQTIEVNYAVITNLQPSRSWSPQVGLILSSYF